MKKILKRNTALLLALLMMISATVLAAGAQSPVNGFGLENGSWYYYKDSKIDTSRNDVIQGTVNGQNGWWYVVGGKVQLGYTGVADYSNAYGWWYIKDGKVDFSCNSVEQNKYGWWYVTGGKVQFGYTGVSNYANDYGWWYIKNGKVDFSKTGVEQNKNGWWRVVNGKVDFSCNSVEQNDYGWWYLVGGKVQFGYTGVADYANAYGWWYIRNGKVDFGHTGVDANRYGWWRVVNGKVDFSCSSVEQNDYGWWYIKDGKVDFNYTGYALNSYGLWYIENGKVNFSHVAIVSDSSSSVSESCIHDWQPVYRTESVKVQDAVYEAKYVCNNCFDFYGDSKTEVQMHINSEHNGIGGFTSGRICVQEAVYEDQQIIDHYVCTICGATKSS